MNVLIISNIKRDPELAIAARVTRELERRAVACTTVELTDYCDSGRVSLDGCDYVFVLGGDGSVLCVAPDCARFGVPILSINLGFVGYLSAFGEHNLEQSLTRFLDGHIELQSRLMLDVNGTLALNEAVIHRGANPRPISLEFFGGRLRGDGLVVATPTGSTAYSFAAGGQSADPCEDALLFTPICAQYPSRKLPGLAELTVSLVGEVPALLSIDGRAIQPLAPGDSIKVKKAAFITKLVKLKG